MKIKFILPISLIICLCPLLFLCRSLLTFQPKFLNDSSIKLSNDRTLTTPVAKLLAADTPTLLHATSQIQLLKEKRQRLEQEIDALQQQITELTEQQRILTEEVTPYIETLSTQYLTPLTNLYSALETQVKKYPTLSVAEQGLHVISYAIQAIEEYIKNPNDSAYETSLQTATDLINQELLTSPMNSIIDITVNMAQSGYTQTMILLKVQEAKDVLETFETTYLTTTNEKTSQFKRSKQQQLATESALELKTLQLDELALQLSGILDEIEQVLN
ncbi:MAG: hypothetical protein K2G70_01320 [Turicibacter sp.]|nr:hypothetical protein [Turicibacter sp.]